MAELEIRQQETQINDLYVVAIGSSAGGLEAINEVAANLRRSTNAAYVVAQHLAPDQPSMLADLVNRTTPLKVVEAEQEQQLEAGMLYTTPPGYNIEISDDYKIVLSPESEEVRSPQPNINLLLCSLIPLAQRGRAIGVILSGSGSDGSRGLAELFSHGGLCIAQDPSTAAYPSMPDAAIRADAINHIAAPSAIAGIVDNYIAGDVGTQSPPITESALTKILELAKTKTGHDLTQYKPATLLRRMHRRMSIHNIDDIAKYLELFESSDEEIDRFVQEAFISVTEFFRDPEHFESLKELLSDKIKSLEPDETIRVWCPGCAGGEEAISIAITIEELRRQHERYNEYVVFATDVDNAAIGRGRAGFYPDNVIAKLEHEIISRYFVPVSGGGYEVESNIRERIVFSRHNVISDPPFSRLDLISCRNMLIYFNQRLQGQVIERFYFGLKTNGILFLGNSESVPSNTNLFAPIETKYRLYRKIGNRAIPPVAY